MNKINVLTRKQQYAVVAFSVVFSLLVVWGAVFGATTISTNVETGGTLSVTGASTLSSATLSSTLDVTGAATLSSTLAVTGSTTVTSVLNVSGATQFMAGIGVGIKSTVADTVQWRPLTADPTAVNGGVYYNNTDKVLRMSDGTNWWTVGTSTSGMTLSGTRVQLATLGTHYITLGTTTPNTSVLLVEATSTATIPLRVRGYGNALAQIANLFEVHNSSGGELFAIDGFGNASGTQLTLSSSLIAKASSTIDGALTVTGAISASSSLAVSTVLEVDGLAKLDGGYASNASSSIQGTLRVNSAIYASSTLEVDSSVIAGTTTVSAVASSSPMQELTVAGDVYAQAGHGTTTAQLQTLESGKGGCIELRGANGITYRMYIGANDWATSTQRASGSFIAIWEPGACK